MVGFSNKGEGWGRSEFWVAQISLLKCRVEVTDIVIHADPQKA